MKTCVVGQGVHEGKLGLDRANLIIALIKRTESSNSIGKKEPGGKLTLKTEEQTKWNWCQELRFCWDLLQYVHGYMWNEIARNIYNKLN